MPALLTSKSQDDCQGSKFKSLHTSIPGNKKGKGQKGPYQLLVLYFFQKGKSSSGSLFLSTSNHKIHFIRTGWYAFPKYITDRELGGHDWSKTVILRNPSGKPFAFSSSCERFCSCANMAMSKNHTTCNQSQKWHRNSIKKLQSQRYESLKGVVPEKHALLPRSSTRRA